MTTETFNAPGTVSPNVGVSREVTPRVLMANFGDGYAQRSGDGINTMETRSSIAFDHITQAEKDATEAFFTRQGGYKSFFWTFPGDSEPKRWIARSWRVSNVTIGVFSMTAELERVFDN